MKILCIGEALIDMICTDRETNLADGSTFLKKPGGAPANAAAAIGALGGDVCLVAKVGNDPFGEQLITVMNDFNVSVEWMIKDNNYFTTLAFVSLMKDGERDFVFNRGADGQLTKADVEQIDLDKISIIHFGSATAFLPSPLQHTYKSFLQKALNKNIFISFDPNYRQLLFRDNTSSFIEQALYFIQHCHFFKMSDEEILLITQSDSLNNAVNILTEKTNATFAITTGKEGAILVHHKNKIMVPGISVTPVDTTGAGDSFVGAVLYQLNKYSLKEIIAFDADSWKHIISNANKVAAQTCEHMGAMEAFKYLSNTIFQ